MMNEQEIKEKIKYLETKISINEIYLTLLQTARLGRVSALQRDYKRNESSSTERNLLTEE